MSTFDVMYPQNPWEGLVTNQREWYDPFLAEFWRRKVIYNAFVTTQFNLADVNAPSMTITRLIPPQMDYSEIATRQFWLASSYIDSEARTITFKHYGGRLSFHKYTQSCLAA